MKTLNLKLVALLMILVTISSCDKEATEDKVSYLENISNIGTNVIAVTYAELASEASDLFDATVALQASQTASNLDIARNAWRDTREPWEKSEGFLFGPVDTKGIDPAIDSWPVNVIDLDAVLASTDALTDAYIEVQIGELKGFHTIEYLLWGATGDKQIGDFTAREFEYLAAVTENLKTKTSVLSTSWATTGDNFVKNLTKAGTSESIYISEKAALEELVGGMIAIADEVANGKINDPLTQQDLQLEESQFSHNSKNDFANNIRSIRNVYNGNYNSVGKGIYDVVKTKNAGLADQLNSEIDAAITAIEDIPGTFSSAVFNDAAKVTTAKDKIAIVQLTLESKVMPLVSAL